MSVHPSLLSAEWRLNDTRSSDLPAELYLLVRAQQAGLPVPESWYGPTPGETISGFWLVRTPFKGGSSASLLPELQLQPAPTSAPHLFQRFNLPLTTRGWLWIDPEQSHDRFQKLTESTSHPLKLQPLWQLPEHPESLEQGLQRLSAIFRRHVTSEAFCLHWGTDETQLWLLALEPSRTWPEGGLFWRDFSLEESLPEYPSPLLLSLFEAASEEITDRWLRHSEGRDTYRPALCSDQGKLFYNSHLVGRVSQQVNTLKIWQFHLELTQQLQHLKQQRNLLMESFTFQAPSLLSCCQQLSAIYARLIGESLWPEQLLQRASTELEQAGVSTSFARQHLSPVGKMLQSLCHLSDSATQIALTAGEPPEKQLLRDPGFRADWQLFLSEYGHHSPDELSLSHPCLAESARFLLPGLLAPWNPLGADTQTRSGGLRYRPLWLQTAALLDAYLTFRSDALWTLNQLKRQLEIQIQNAVKQKKLSCVGDFWQLNLEEIAWLEHGEQLPEGWLKPHNNSHPRTLPAPLLTGRSQPRHLEREGWLWCPASPAEILPETLKPWQAILVLKRLDPVHYLQVMQVSAVLLAQRHDFNGGLSLLREWGIPVISGLGQSLDHLITGQAVRLSGGCVEFLTEQL